VDFNSKGSGAAGCDVERTLDLAKDRSEWRNCTDRCVPVAPGTTIRSNILSSLDDDAMKTLVHAFITSRVDYCNAVLAGSLKFTPDTLQRVLNAAARLVTDTDKYDRCLSSLLHDQLHWLNVPERIKYKLAVMIRRCLEDKAPTYVSDYCIASGHRRQQPTLTFSQPASTDCTALSANYIWPSGFLCCRPDGLELTTDWVSRSVGFDVFRRTVKTILFARY